MPGLPSAVVVTLVLAISIDPFGVCASMPMLDAPPVWIVPLTIARSPAIVSAWMPADSVPVVVIDPELIVSWPLAAAAIPLLSGPAVLIESLVTETTPIELVATMPSLYLPAVLIVPL